MSSGTHMTARPTTVLAEVCFLQSAAQDKKICSLLFILGGKIESE